MPVKFLELVDDPYKNNSNLFLLVISMDFYGVPTPTGPGSASYVTGIVYDQNGQNVGALWEAFYQDYEVTGTLSDEAYSHSYTHDQKSILVPPGFSIKDFTAAMALQGTLEELAPFIRGM
jgi:hypothetical protein